MSAQSTALSKSNIVTDLDTWELLYEREMPRIYNFFRYRLQDNQLAEDLTARTFEKAWRERNRYQRDKAAYSTWLFTIARHTAIDHFRKQHELDDLDDRLTAQTPTPEEHLQQEETLRKLARLLEDLPQREQELIALKYGASLSNRECARIMDISAANAGIILFRTVRKLRRQWEDFNG